jgi:PAS domain S-box-containing protein
MKYPINYIYSDIRRKTEDFIRFKESGESLSAIDDEVLNLLHELLDYQSKLEAQIVKLAENEQSGRKKAEEALSKTKLQLEDVLEGANIGTLEWNVQTGKVKFNSIWARNLGYTSTEIKIGLALLGKKGWRTITHPDDIPYADEMLQKHFSGELPFHSVEVRMRHKKGHWVWFHQVGRVKTWTADGKPLLMYDTRFQLVIQVNQ